MRSIKSDEFWIRLCTGWVLAVDEMKKDWKKNWFRNICSIAWYGYWLLVQYVGTDLYLQASDAEDYKGMIAGITVYLIGLMMFFMSGVYRVLSSKIENLKDKA